MPAATLPFGMLASSPDTLPAVTNTPAGYSYRDQLIRGFSLHHVSGAGCSIYQDVSFMPTTERLRGSPVHAGDSDIDHRYMAAFSHKREAAEPGLSTGSSSAPGGRRKTSVALTAATRDGDGADPLPAPGTPVC